MRKICGILVALVLGLSLLSSCGSSGSNGSDVDKDSVIPLTVGTYHDKNWDETVGTYNGVVVPDEKVAVEIAKAIFEGIEKSVEAQKYTAQSVFYDEKDEVWVVHFNVSAKETTLGGGCTIAIQKKDGKVLRVWYGE